MKAVLVVSATDNLPLSSKFYRLCWYDTLIT